MGAACFDTVDLLALNTEDEEVFPRRVNGLLDTAGHSDALNAKISPVDHHL